MEWVCFEYLFSRLYGPRILQKMEASSESETKAFAEVKKALKTLEFGSQEESSIFSIVASILHLGNIAFTEAEGDSRVIIREVVEYVAKVSSWAK